MLCISDKLYALSASTPSGNPRSCSLRTPAPTQAAVAPAVPRAQTPRASTQTILRGPGGGAGRLSKGSLSPTTSRRLRGLPAPGNRRETRPGTPVAATLHLHGDPPRAAHLEFSLPGSALERRPREGTAQASSAKGPAPQPHLLRGPLSAPPRHGFFLGHESTNFTASARSAAQGGGLAPAAAAASVRSAPAPPRGQGLGGAPPTARGNGRSAGPRGCLGAVSRLTVRAAGRLGTARGASLPRLDRHVSVPFFSPAFRPFPQNSTFLSPSLALSSCGGGWKRAVGEKAWRGGGGAALRPRPREGPRFGGHRSSPPTPARPPLGAGSESCGPPKPSSAFARPSLRKQSWGESALEVAVHPFLRGSASVCDDEMIKDCDFSLEFSVSSSWIACSWGN
ncbi:translation initiation factor IF-2-like [Trachypithecus francoisi]|uniref:translation initiation factor IF-2-like n=1 Tax=Trachypithecus francoisi TaxID=54180 RepID=UPI00141B73A1|nr:translation initiation factor IF-2-like [Trachypithecus francoisi]